MNELPNFEPTKEVPPQSVDRQALEQRMRQKFAYSFVEYGSPQEAIEGVLSIPENRRLIEATGRADAIRKQLLACATITDKDAFAEAVFQAMLPAIDILYTNPDTFPQPDRGRVSVNEMLEYNIQGNSLRIHIFTGGAGDLRLYLEGLSTVAEVVSKNPEIKTIDAISWIVLKDQRIIERKLGFTIRRGVDGKPVVVDTVEGQDYGHASMTREDFIAKYLKKK